MDGELSIYRRSALIGALRVGAAAIWRAYPTVATGVYEANSYIVGKEHKNGQGWTHILEELREEATNLLYQKYADTSPIRFKAGMAIGLLIIDTSHYFQVDALSVVHRPLNYLIASTAEHERNLARRILFDYAAEGFDIIKPQFSLADTDQYADTAILPASRNPVFEFGVGLVLRATLDSSGLPEEPGKRIAATGTNI